MLGQVTTWQMTPEELAAYIEKYPIKKHDQPIKKESGYKWKRKKRLLEEQ